MSHTVSPDPDELLDDTAERPVARGPRRRTVSEGPATGHEVLNNPASARISRVAGLSRRNVRTKHRRFLVEGHQGVSTDAQGVLAVVAVEEASGSEALATALDGARLVAVLTQAQDPGNAGAIIRAADAAGADAVVLVRGSVDPTAPKVVRSTAGSLFHLPVVTGVALDDAVAALHEAGLTVLAADSSRPSLSWRRPAPGCSATRPAGCPQRR